jgi:O-antigen/teichoic acid export membrane protein
MRPADGSPEASRRSAWVAARAHLRRLTGDGLVRNSFYLASTDLTMGALGFVFWVIGARLYTPSQVGLATALISAAAIVSTIGLVGMNTTFIRFLPSSKERDTEISSGLWLVFAATAAAAVAYLLLMPSLAPRLDFVRESPWLGLGFVMMTAFSAVNLVTDSIFIAYQKAQYNLLIDGLVQGLTKLLLPVLLIGLGAYGLFAAVGLSATVAVVASIVVVIGVFGFRPHVAVSARFLKRAWRFSAASYASSLLTLTPALVVPLIVLNERGPSQAAYYYVAFRFATLLTAFVDAAALSFLAEGSQEGAELPALMRRSAKLVALISVPGGLLVAAAGHWLLMVFGLSYSSHATAALAALAIATPAVGLYEWSLAVLFIRKRLRMLVLVNTVFAAVTVGLSLAWAGNGLAWVAAAWLIGHLCAGIIGAAAATRRAKTAGATAD